MKALAALSLLLSSLATAHAAEDWDFTPADYQALLAKGKQLRFGADSNWLPVEFQKNILVTLNYALDATTVPRRTDGINSRDFYHAHVACDTPMMTKLIDYNQPSRSVEILEEHGLNRLTVTAEQLPKLVEAIKVFENENSLALKKLLESRFCDLVMIYHTYETGETADGTKIEADDLRRHLITYQSTLAPVNSFSTDQGAFQIAFLVDQNGVVHATAGSFLELSKVTGVLESR